MRSSSSFRRALRPALLVWLLSITAAHAQSRPPLFVAPARDLPAPPTVAAGARARLVGVRGDLLAAALDARDDAVPFVLNLFDDVVLDLRRLRVDASTPGYRTWIGTTPADESVVATLTLGPAGLSGSAVASGVAYALAAAGEDVIVRELPAIAPGPELPARRLAAADAAAAPAVLLTPGAPRIDVLVLYTPAARQREGGTAAMEATLANAVAVTNAAFERSAVDAALVTAAIRELPYAESADGLVSDLSALADGGPVYAAVEALRVAVGADLVALVVGRPTSALGCGVAYLGPAPTAIYSVTEATCLVAGQWSFSHEVGHNFGADHAPGDPIVSAVPYARGYRDATVRTLMAYPVPGSPLRSLNFSSSTVREPAGSGAPTGNSLQDNARRLAETAAVVSAFTTSVLVPDAPSGILASVSNRTVTVTWSPPATGGPVTGYALDAGLTSGAAVYGPFTTTAHGIVFPGIADGRYYVRLRSLGPGGASITSGDVIVQVGPPCDVPGPARVTAVVGTGQATVQWFAPAGTGETRYELGLGSAPGALDLGVFAVGTLRAATVPAPPGQYFVRARGVNACGPGGVSPELRVVVP